MKRNRIDAPDGFSILFPAGSVPRHAPVDSSDPDCHYWPRRSAPCRKRKLLRPGSAHQPCATIFIGQEGWRPRMEPSLPRQDRNRSPAPSESRQEQSRKAGSTRAVLASTEEAAHRIPERPRFWARGVCTVLSMPAREDIDAPSTSCRTVQRSSARGAFSANDLYGILRKLGRLLPASQAHWNKPAAPLHAADSPGSRSRSITSPGPNVTLSIEWQSPDRFGNIRPHSEENNTRYRSSWGPISAPPSLLQ